MTTTKFGGTGPARRPAVPCPRGRVLALGAVLALGVPLAACGGGDSEAGKRMPDRPGASAPKPAAARPDWIPGFVAGMSLEEQVGQLFVADFGSRASAERLVRRQHVGGLIYFPNNIRDPEQTARMSNALQRAAKIPLLIAVDQENGIVSRLPYVTRFPGNMALGATLRPADVREAARVTGAELRAVGINQNYAPVADVNVNPANPVIGVRSFGSDPGLVARLLGAAVQGYQAAGVAATAKHFPGHGDTDTDSHTGLPVIHHSPARWERVDAPPFRAAVRAGVDAIMSAHIVVPGLDRSGDPATMSRTVLTGLLRDKLGFQGVIVTDSLRMTGARVKYGPAEAAVRAVKAGADQLLMPPDLPGAYDAVLAAVRRGEIPRQRVAESVTRILRMKERRGLFGNVQADPAKAARILGSPGNEAAARRVAEHSITLVKNSGPVLPLRDRQRVYVTGPESGELAAALRRRDVPIAGSPGKADLAVLTTLDESTGTEARIRSLGSRRVVVAALGRPYDLGYAGRADAALATYSSSAVSISALSKVLTGEVKPSGKLPVAVRGYSFGHGLTY